MNTYTERGGGRSTKVFLKFFSNYKSKYCESQKKKKKLNAWGGDEEKGA